MIWEPPESVEDFARDLAGNPLTAPLAAEIQGRSGDRIALGGLPSMWDTQADNASREVTYQGWSEDTEAWILALHQAAVRFRAVLAGTRP